MELWKIQNGKTITQTSEEYSEKETTVPAMRVMLHSMT